MTMLKQFKYLWVILVMVGCIEPYTPPEIENNPNILVVDGFLDGTKRECLVSLTRTQSLGSTEPPMVEIGATVSLQEKDGNTFVLIEQLNGKYSITNLPVGAQKEYKINVKTIDGKEYTSDYVVLKPSPPIDSVTWEATDQGVQIHTTTHDPSNIARYYQWKFIETWQYTAAYYSNQIFQNGNVAMRDDDIYNCWQQESSTNILIGSTDKFTQDVIYKYPITLLPKETEKYQIRYSILVQQRVLSKEAYNYWSELQKNTENLGTLFDPQPSQILGNIYEELPKGYPFNREFPGCKLDTVLLADLPNFGKTGNLLTTTITIGGIIVIGYGNSTVDCVDCRSKGGTNVPPDFW
jgi:hypothetical protein